MPHQYLLASNVVDASELQSEKQDLQITSTDAAI
jgi:hypothetical protein